MAERRSQAHAVGGDKALASIEIAEDGTDPLRWRLVSRWFIRTSFSNS